MTPVDVLYAASETPAPQSDHIKMANGGKKPPRKLEKAKTLSWERPDAQLNATSIGSRPLACTNRRYRRLKHTTNPHVVAWLKVSHVMPTHEHAAKALPTVQGTGARSRSDQGVPGRSRHPAGYGIGRVMVLESSVTAAVLANTRPSMTVPVMTVMDACARIVPLKT